MRKNVSRETFRLYHRKIRRGRRLGVPFIFETDKQKARMYFCVPRSLDIYLECLMLVDFIHGLIDIPA